MNWGDAPAWAAITVSLAAIVVSLKARGDGRRSADAAEQSVQESRRSGDAAERSAAAAEEALADQRREAAERRAVEEEVNRPRAKLAIEHATKARWQLINRGTATAEDVRCLEEVPAMVRPWPDGLSLAPGELHDFMMAGSMQRAIPSVIRFLWDGQDEPVPLRVPPRIR